MEYKAECDNRAVCFDCPQMSMNCFLGCKHPQDAEEKFPMQQQFFPSFPLFQPFFYNGAVTGLRYPQNSASDSVPKEALSQPGNENGNIPQPGHFFSQNISMNNPTLGEDGHRSQMFGPEFQFMGPPFYFPNGPEHHQYNSIFQKCGCGDSFPWSCRSFIVPMISYCVFWNSRNSNMNFLGGNSTETVCRRNKQCEKHADTNEECQACVMKDINNNSANTKSCEQSPMTNGEWEKEEKFAEDAGQNSPKSSPSVTLTASSFAKDGIEQAEKRNLESGSECSSEEEASGDEDEDDEVGKDEEDEDATETSESECQDKNDEVVTANEKDSSYVSFPKEPQKENKSKKKDSTETEIFCMSEVDRSDTSAEADQTNHVHDEGQNTSAAGDLGGTNCRGYKVNIQEPFEEGTVLQGTETEQNPQSKTNFLKGVTHPEGTKKEENYSPKSSEKYPKTGRISKSGIAKLMTNPKLNDSRKNAVKTVKTNTKEPSQKEPALMKRKHSCFPCEDTLSNPDCSAKIQKTRSPRVLQQQNQAPEKLQRTRQIKTETPRKRENTTKTKPVISETKK